MAPIREGMSKTSPQAAEAAATQCEISINTQKAALEILNADLAISEKVQLGKLCKRGVRPFR